MAIAELRNDAVRYLESLSSTTVDKLDLKTELMNNVLPLFIGLADAALEIDQDIDALSEAVEALDPPDDVIQPQTADIILGTIETGSLLAGEVDKIIVAMKGEKPAQIELKKRLQALVAAWRQGAQAVTMIVVNATAPEEEEGAGDDVGDPPEDDGLEGDDGDDADGDDEDGTDTEEEK